MPDIRRVVTLSEGGRPVVRVDLEVADFYQAVADSFAYEPGQADQQIAREPGRFGGGQVVDEEQANGTVKWQALVQGVGADQVAGRVDALLAQVADAGAGRLLEWRPDGVMYSSFFRLAGPGRAVPMYKWVEFAGASCMVVELSFPVRPLVLWAPMTIGDDFDVDSRGDYSFDAMTAADMFPTGFTSGNLLGSERRARHTARGYQHREGQGTLSTIPGAASLTGYKAGVIVRGKDAGNYVEVYVDDTGTAGRLRIDVITAGARVNRASVNLAARLGAGYATVHGRIESGIVYANYYPDGLPEDPGAASTSYALAAGEADWSGYGGWSLTPQHGNSRLDYFEFAPCVRRDATLPTTLGFWETDALPGTAPALADVTISPSGGAARPLFALIAWGPAGVDDGIFNYFGEHEAESALGGLAGWATSAQAGARGGSDVRATTAGAATYTAGFSIDPQAVEADEFSGGTIEIEVWARALVSSTLINPRLIASLRPWSSLGAAGERFTHEFGAAGRTLAKPSAGSVYRPVRLGTLTATIPRPYKGQAPLAMKLLITGKVDADSAGVFGLDYIWCVAARHRALAPTGVPGDSSYPAFVPDTGAWGKTIRADLSGRLASGSLTVSDHGLGGALIQPRPSDSHLFVKLSSLVPDDPTVDATSEQLAHTADVQVDVTPRSYLLRGI